MAKAKTTQLKAVVGLDANATGFNMLSTEGFKEQSFSDEKKVAVVVCADIAKKALGILREHFSIVDLPIQIIVQLASARPYRSVGVRLDTNITKAYIVQGNLSLMSPSDFADIDSETSEFETLTKQRVCELFIYALENFGLLEDDEFVTVDDLMFLLE